MSLLLSLLLTPALAWDLEAIDAVDLPEGEAALGLVQLDSGPALVTGGEASWSLVEPLTGEVLLSYEISAHAAAGMDLDGDDGDEVLVCTDDGLWAYYMGADAVGPDQLDSATCTAVVAADVPAAADGSEVRVYSDVPEVGGSFEGATSSPPVLVGAGEAFAVSAAGDWSVHQVAAMEVTTLSAGGKVQDLVVHQGAWAWSLVEEAQVVVDGEAVDVGNRPGPLASADLDGDGTDSLVVVYATHGELGVLLDEGGERLFELGEGASDVLWADLDEDGCEDLLLVGEGQVVPALVTDCDGGGGPDTGEGCYDPEVRVSRRGAPEEGRQISFELAYDPGCYPDADPHWEVDFPNEPVAACQERMHGLECDLLDNGGMVVRMSLQDSAGQVLSEWAEGVQVENRPPELLYFPTFLNLGDELVDEPLQARDVATDTITWTLVDGVEGMVLTPDGRLSYSAEEAGWWDISVVLSDEDGGTAVYQLWFEVWDDGSGGDDDDDPGESGCCCAGASAAGAVPVFLLLGLARRRRL